MIKNLSNDGAVITDPYIIQAENNEHPDWLETAIEEGYVYIVERDSGISYFVSVDHIDGPAFYRMITDDLIVKITMPDGRVYYEGSRYVGNPHRTK